MWPKLRRKFARRACRMRWQRGCTKEPRRVGPMNMCPSEKDDQVLVSNDQELEIPNAAFVFVRDAPLKIREQFESIPMKILLSKGESLFRFLEVNSMGDPSGFWLPTLTYHHLRLVNLPFPEWAVTKSGDFAKRPDP